MNAPRPRYPVTLAALPETVEDALIVLELAKQLVEGFLATPQRPDLSRLDRERGVVVSLSSATSNATADKRP